MKYLLALSLMIGSAVNLSSGAGEPVPRSPRPDEGVQTIEVTAKKYEFNPASIRVKQGTRVQLKITAMDHDHGFQIREMPEDGGKGKPGLVFTTARDCTKIEKGKSETIEFVAQTPGTYPFHCCVHCGLHHRSMKGELIVEP